MTCIGGLLCSVLSNLYVRTALLALVILVLWKRFVQAPACAPRRASAQSTDFPQLQLSKKGAEIKCVNPATGEHFKTEHSYTKEEVQEVVARARIAQKQWVKTSFAERRAVLQDLMHYVVEHQDEICRASVCDTGKTVMEAEYGEVLTTCEKIRYIMREGEAALSPESRSGPLLLFLKKAHVEYYPIGVIGIIVPWNYPFHNVASAVVAAIFSGNAAVVKVSEFATGSREYFQEIFRKILLGRGHNPDLVQLIAGYGDTGANLIKSGVDKVFFIGSPQTGKKVMTTAAESLTPVTLELGGKDPFIVFADAEFDHAVDVAMRGVFTNCGQNCIAAERLYIQDSIYEKFSKAVAQQASSLRQGASINGGCFDCGSITMPNQVSIVEELVNDAVKHGATVLAGGKRNGKLSNGLFFEPTVLSNVTHEMRIVNEEVFGPVMLLIPFKTEEQVIEMANGTQYALGCSIFSTDYQKTERVAKQIQSGMCTINDFGVSYMIQSLPFGGAKISGFGRFNGPEGLRSFCVQKSVVTDRFPIRTKAPSFVKYPIPANGPKIVKHAIAMFYGRSIRIKLLSLFGMLREILSGSRL